MAKTDLSFTYSTYQGTDDLIAMQQSLADWINKSGGCGYEHIGDLPHRIYNGVRSRYPLNEIIRLWHIDGNLEGFAMIYPWRGEYDVRISPKYRASTLESEVLGWATTTMRTRMDNEGTNEKDIMADVYTCDTQRIDCLVELGYQPEEKPCMNIYERRLDADIPDANLPDGYSIRSARNEADAAELAFVHSGAFGSNWTTEVYLNEVMRKPGYDPALEHAVVAPNGKFVAFCITWLDSTNGIGLFEPVGTHKDYHRKGLGRALLSYGLCFMQERGMQLAQVGSYIDNPASNGLYQAVGFKPKYQIITYHKR
jgi:mycothiol synthase